MQVLFSTKIEPCVQPYAGPDMNYSGILTAYHGQYIYARHCFGERIEQLMLYTFSLDGILLSTECFEASDETKEHTFGYLWRAYETGDDVCIMVGDNVCFSLSQKAFGQPEEVIRQRWCAEVHRDEPYFYSEAAFAFDEYEIRHRGERSFICLRDGKEAWRCRLQGYLYTDMVRYDLPIDGSDPPATEAVIVFGTAGMGGHFMGLRLADGSPRFDLNTRGTDRYLYDRTRFFVPVGKRGGGIAAVSADGSVEMAPLAGYAFDHLPICLVGHTLLTISVTANSACNHFYDVYLNGIDMTV